MRTISVLLILLALSACASSGAFLEYKPPHWKGSDWAITGKAETEANGDAITITINQTDVITGIVSKQKPENEFTNSYEGYNISAKCKLKNSGEHSCTVLVDNETAGQLSF